MNKTCRIGWTSTAPITKVCALVWRSSIEITTVCRTGWQFCVPVQTTCRTGWRNTASISRTCALGWRYWDGQAIQTTCALGWQEIETDPEPSPSPPAAPADDVLVTVDGQIVDPVRISINQSRQQAAIDAEIELATEAEWLICRRLAPATIRLWDQIFSLVVDSRDRAETFGSTTWTARLASPVIGLDMADPVIGELTGLASEIAFRLTSDLRYIRWQVADWHIGPGRWIANGQTPLALLQALVTACGAALLSTPDGGLEVVPQYPVSVPAWPTATPAHVFDRNVHLISIQTSAELAEGIDAITVRDQEAATDTTLRIVEDTEKRRAKSTEVLVYQVPWSGNFHLTHRGLTERVVITNLYQEERVIEDEEIIITDGSGHTSLPVYAILSARYNARNLGTPTYSEDGTITTAVQDDSILLLTYRTRARRYHILSEDRADLLIVAETID